MFIVVIVIVYCCYCYYLLLLVLLFIVVVIIVYRTNSPPWHTKGNEDILTDGHRLAQRQKQIEMGKNTIGYESYIATLPK